MYNFVRTGLLTLVSVTFGAGLMAQYSQPVRDVENPARSPFWFSSVETQFAEHSEYMVLYFSFPSGKRLVIEHLSAQCRMAPGDTDDNVARAGVYVNNGSDMHTFRFGMEKQAADSSGYVHWFASQPMRLYSENGMVALNRVAFYHSKLTSRPLCHFSLSGYTISTP